MEEMHYFRKVDIEWELPALLSSSPPPQGPDPSSATGLGHANFSSWCRRFVEANIAHQAVLARNTDLPLEAYAATHELQLSGKWTESPTALDAMNDEPETAANGAMVQAVLEELGIMTPQSTRRHSIISIGSSSSVSTSNDRRPSSSGTSGTDVLGTSSGGDAASIVEDDKLNIHVTGTNDCNKVTSEAPTAVGTENKDDTNIADGLDKTEHTDTPAMDAPKRQPSSQKPASSDMDMSVQQPRSSSKRPAGPSMQDLAAATEAELRELERYFPAVSKDAIFCVGCASYGHRIQSCPFRTCRLCDGNIGDHGLFGCPALSPTDVVFRIIAPLKTVPVKKGKNSNRKGKGKKEKERAKARELEEAAWAPEPERPARMCKLCLQVTAHQDVCPMLWTTFVPNPLHKRKADQISASCYFCGADGHFGGDCSKNTGTHLSGRQFSLPDDIWCQKYADKCIGSDNPEKEDSAIGKQTPAKRAKTSAEVNTPNTGKPSPAQNPAGGKPAAPTLSKAQIKKANRKQRLAEEARGVLAKQSKASKGIKIQTALQTELPSRSAPVPAPTTQKTEKGEKPAPAATPAAQEGVVVEGIKGLAGTGKTAPMPASKVYDLSKQKPHLPPLKVLEKKPAKQPQPQPPTKKKAKAKKKQNQMKAMQQKQQQQQQQQAQKSAHQPAAQANRQVNQQPSQQKPKQQRSAQQQPAQQPGQQPAAQPGQPGPPKLTRKQRKQAAEFASAKANAQFQQAMQGMPGQGSNMPKSKPPRRRRRAADEMDI